MAAITSAGSGNWASTTPNAPWPSGTVPVNGDTVTIANGHTITIPTSTSVTIGDSANPTTYAIRTAGTGGTGALVVNGTLSVNGDLLQGNATWSVGAGGIVESVNTTTALVWYIGDGGGQTPTLSIIGTSAAARATVRKGSGATGFRINGAAWGGHVVTMQWAAFTGLGSSSATSVTLGMGSAGRQWVCTDTIWDGCGKITTGSGVALTSAFEWRRVTIKNATDATYTTDIALTAGTPSATRVFEDVIVTSNIKTRLNRVDGMTITRCAFQGGIEFIGPWADMVDCLLGNDPVGDPAIELKGPVTRGIRFTDNAAGWHAFNYDTAGAFVFDGMIFDGATGADSTGDLLQMPSLGSAFSITVKNALTTKADNASGCYGKLVSLLGGANSTVTSIEHCTHFSQNVLEGGMVGVSETYIGRANMVQNLKSNITVGLSAGNGVLVTRDNGGASNDVYDTVTPANMTNNVCYNAKSGGAGVGNGNRTQSGGTGNMWVVDPANPTDVNPTFVDDSRNLATWYRSLVGGSPGTRSADQALAIAAIASQFDGTPVAGATIPNAWAWIRAGFVPTNTAARIAHDSVNNGWAGAVAGAAAGAIAAISSGYHQRMMR